MTDYITLNKANWDQRAPLHAASHDYEVEQFLRDPAHLSEIVRFDRARLGDIDGLRAIHLQCHIGTDTLSLARLGAEMTGLDFSPASLAQARRLAHGAGASITFVESDVYDAAHVLPPAAFDLVYTGIGALCWLPSVERWARAAAALLAPGGRLFMREGHPVLWSVNEARRDGLAIEYPYFERPEPTVWNSSETYVTTDVPLTATTTHEWNHGLGEVVSALLGEGMTITGLVEHDSVPWEALPGQMTRDDRGEWSLTRDRWRMPLSYTLQAMKQPRAGD